MIKAPEGAEVLFEGNLSEDFVEVLNAEISRIAMSYLREIDPSINQDGIVIWPIDPDGCGVMDWYYQIDWNLLKDEAYTFCSNFSPSDGSEYDPQYIERMKMARDGFAELASIFDAEISAGKPSQAVMDRM